jgi:hypothetical protein
MFLKLGLNNEKSILPIPLRSVSFLSLHLHINPPSPSPPSRFLGQFDHKNIKNSSGFRNYDCGDRNMTGRQDDRQRILDKYMIDVVTTYHLCVLDVFSISKQIFIQNRFQRQNSQIGTKVPLSLS